MAILNLTQHAATQDQIAAGVVDLPADDRAAAMALLTFDTLPSPSDVLCVADALTKLVQQRQTCGAVMIGGAPFLMAPLQHALLEAGFEVVYAFSVRESADHPQPDGTVRKVAVFRHAGFVHAA